MNHEIYSNSQTATPIHNNQSVPAKLNPQMNPSVGQVPPPGPYHSSGTPMSQHQLNLSSQNFGSLAQHQYLNNQQQIQLNVNSQGQTNLNGNQYQNQIQPQSIQQSSLNSASKPKGSQLQPLSNMQKPSTNLQDEMIVPDQESRVQIQAQHFNSQTNAQIQMAQHSQSLTQSTQPQPQNSQSQNNQAQQPKGEGKDVQMGGSSAVYKQVDVLIIGGGPASLGIMVNGVKTNRLNELLQGDGVAIVDAGLNFGGGLLSHYGINSNTSGGGFLKCTFKKQKDKNKEGKDEFSAYAQKQTHQDKKGGAITKQPLKKKKVVSQQQNNHNQNEDQTHVGQSNSRQQLNPPNNDRRKTMSQLTQQQQLQKQQQQQQQQLSQLLNQACIQAAQTLRGPALEQMLQNPYAQQLMTSQQAAPTGPFKKKEDIEILPPYRDLYHSNIGKVLKEFGKNTAPLGLIGHFLNYAGNHLLSYIYQTTKKKIFYPLHKAISVQLMQNGEILTKVKRQQVEVNEEGEFVQFVETEQIVCFRSKAVVISNGGVQGLHPDLFNWFPNLDPAKTIPSDPFLRSGLYISTMKKINEQNLKKIVIIGGSHSGFSCAWMLLNGPASYYKNNAGLHIEKEPNAQRKQIKNCIDCCQCGAAQIISKKNKESTKGGKEKAKDINIESQLSPQGNEGLSGNQCKCTCICFGFFHYDEWGFDYNELIPQYEDYAIEILYRDHIRVFYNKVSDAEQDGYREYEPSKFAKKDGYLYSFTGLRGDAKELYLRIMRGQEKRVALIQAKTVEEQRPYVERADVVIWACGYQTKKLIIKDTDRRRLQLSQKVDNTQFDVDGKCRIMLADGQVLSKVYGCGIAYPVRTKDGMLVSNPNMTNPRADGFSLYMGFVGDQMLKNLLPKNKYAKNSVHKMIPQKKENLNGVGQGSAENQMTQKNYQQIVRARLQQYKNTVKTALEGAHDERNVLRHKSLNAREEIHNNLRRSQLGGPSQDIQQDGNNQESQEFQMQVEQMQTNMEEIINQKRKLSGASNSLPAGSKSVDRAASKNGNFQNKLAQMARSPQILQKKQQHVLKSHNQQANPIFQTNGQQLHQINENLIYQGTEAMQILHSQTNHTQMQQRINKAKNEQFKKVKSPYNQGQHKNTTKLNKIALANGSQEIGQLHTQVPSRQGRDIMRSQQANRQQNQMKSTEPPFKMHRSQNINSQGNHHQISLKQKKGQQTHGQQSQLNQMLFNNQLYNSSGANLIGNMQIQNINELQMNSMRQERLGGGIELPPILHPLNQNHYVGMQSANQRATAANEYYMNQMTTNSNDQLVNRNLYNLTQGPDELNTLQQAQTQGYRQLSYTQYNHYDGAVGQHQLSNYEYTITNDPAVGIQQQEFTPSNINHSKRNSQALYVQNDDYFSDDEEEEEQSPNPVHRSKKPSTNKKRFEKQQSQTLNAQFKNLTLDDEQPYRNNNQSDEEDDIERANHNQFTLADDPNYQGSDFENDDEPHRPRKNPHQLMTENHQMLNADIQDASSSHYVEGESDHENEEAVSFGDDVSSEGSCIASNSYKRSQLDQTKGGDYDINGNGGYDDDFNMMDEYDRDREEEEEEEQLRRQAEEDENVDIPDEEMLDTPRKGMNNLPIQDREMIGAKNFVGVSSRRAPQNENQVHLQEDELLSSQPQSLQCQSINTNNSSNIQIAPSQALQKNQVNIRSDKAQQSKFIQGSSNQLLQPHQNSINDYKKQFVKKQLSPVLLNRNSTNNLSNQKPSIRESQELLRDKRPSGGLGDSSKKKYLNPGTVGSTAASNKKAVTNQFIANSNKMDDTPMIDLSQPSTTQSQNASHSTPTASNFSQSNQQRGRLQQSNAVIETAAKNYIAKNQLQQQLATQQQEYIKRNYLGGSNNQGTFNQHQGSQNKPSNNFAQTLKKKLAGGQQTQSQGANYYQSQKNNNNISLNNGAQVLQATVNASHLMQGAGFNIEDSLGSSNGFGGSSQSHQLTGASIGGVKTPGSYKSYNLGSGIAGAPGFNQSRFGNSNMQQQLSTGQNLHLQQQAFKQNGLQQNQVAV